MLNALRLRGYRKSRDWFIEITGWFAMAVYLGLFILLLIHLYLGKG